MDTRNRESVRPGTPAKRLGERRRYERLEIVGTLRGALEIAEPAVLIDVSQAGALLHVRAPVVAHSTLPLTLTTNGLELTISGAVRHVSQRGPNGSKGAEYRVGVAFPSPVAVFEAEPD